MGDLKTRGLTPTHLDTRKSMVVSSPAGSGKTQKLAERYVALLEEGVPPERILAITFTEKAAAEMKERVLTLLLRRLPGLHTEIQPKLSRFRISTVHSFALSVLERFAFDLNLAPNLEILDAIEADLIRDEVIREGLVELGSRSSEASLWIRHLTLVGSWTRLRTRIRSLFQQIPLSYLAYEVDSSSILSEYETAWEELREAWGKDFWEASGFEKVPDPRDKRRHIEVLRTVLDKISVHFLTKSGSLRKRFPKDNPDILSKAESFARFYEVLWRWRATVETEGLITVFKHLALNYERRKRAEKVLDFGDLEYKLYEVLYHSPNWSNVLLSFDEQTDHILLDEFQDTNGLQWAIVSKLIEEWRSGMGAKKELGKTPTLFIVGDVKQSIYLFRGANVEVFEKAKLEMREWMRQNFEEVVLRENYRSLPLIVDFANELFSRLMYKEKEDEAWKTPYEKFISRRNPGYKGHVEILLTGTYPSSLMEEQKRAEAVTIAERISEIAGVLPVFERGGEEEIKRACRFEDITILIRARTHLASYEEALRRHAIPFVVVGGTGFYSAPETVLLKQLVQFLANPSDSLSLYGIMRSPLLGFSEDEILNVAFTEGVNLWNKLFNLEKHKSNEYVLLLAKMIARVDMEPSSILFESILKEYGLWSWFADEQQKENIHKFLRILEAFDEEGLSMYRIAERLERMSSREDEPKANMNVEGRNAVRIMTIHAAKGLDSKVVFLAGLEEPSSRRGEGLSRREQSERVIFTFTDSSYKEHPEKLLWEAKIAEEQKRLFYVGVTRARDALFLSGTWNGKATGWLDYLAQGVGMHEGEKGFKIPLAPKGTNIDLRPSASDELRQEITKIHEEEPLSILERQWPVRQATFRVVSDDLERRTEEVDGLIHFGEIVHILLDKISRGLVLTDNDSIHTAVSSIVFSFNLAPSRVAEYASKIQKQIESLRVSGHLERYILPRENAESEIPFLLRKGNEIVSGRIDRVLITPQGLDIIDYKSFPSGIEVKEVYKEQLRLYADAAKKIWKLPVHSCFILFTADAHLMEVELE